MTSLTEFFNKHEDDTLKGISHKNSIIKRNIIAHMAVNGECTLSELTKELHISVPTITKLVQELVDENIVTDLGKVETPGGRRPNIFGLANSAIYFAGVNVGRDNMTFLITDLQNNIIKEEYDYTFELLDRPQCIERICTNIENFIATCGIDRGKILGLGVCMTGRVNPDTGRSYKYFTTSEQSLRDLLEERVGIRVLLENDTRARCYAEYTCGKSKDESNVLYLHMGRGVAIGIVVDGQLYYGKSGFAGEFGHIPFFDNEIICSCGKKGCLETEVSGIAIEDKMSHLIERGVNTILKEKYDKQKSIHIDDIIAAAKNDDNLSIELIEEAGEKVGKAVAFLINTFNPETVIVGGNMAAAGDYIMLPLKSATNKYSLNLVYKDTKFRVSKMTENANAWVWRCLSATRSSASDEPRRPDNAAESLGTGRHRPDVRLGERHGGMERQRHAGPLFAPHARTVHSGTTVRHLSDPPAAARHRDPRRHPRRGARLFRAGPDQPPDRHRNPDPRRRAARQRLCVGCRGDGMPLRPRSAEPAPALVQRRFRQRPQPETLRQSGIRRSRRQTRLAMAAGRLRR